MADINIKIKQSTREVSIDRNFAGVQMENLQDKLKVRFVDEFVDGNANLEYQVNGESYYVAMDKEEEVYTLPIEQILISEEGTYPFQVRIENENKVFKSKIFYFKIYPSLNAQDFPPSYQSWKDWVIEYVDENGGAINVVQKNGVELPIVDKVVNIPVPTKTSDLQNDSGYITNSDLNGYATKQWVENQNYLTENDLPSVDQTYDSTSENAQSGKAVAEALNSIPTIDDYNDLNNIPIENIQDNTIYEEGAYYKQDKQYKYGKFTNNQAINTLSRIYFDTSKTDEMVNWFKTLSYSGDSTYGLATLIQGRGDFGLMVLKVVINNEDVYCLVRVANVVAFVYATDNGSFEGMSWTRGWHLDEGDVISWDAGDNASIKYIVNDSDRWNGYFFGTSKTEISGDILRYKDNALTKQLFTEDRVLDLGTIYSEYGEIPEINREVEISEEQYNKVVNNKVDAVKISVEFPDSSVYIGYKLYAGRITDVINYNPSNNQYSNAYVFKGEVRFADNNSDLIVAIAPTQTGYEATIQTQAKAKITASDIDSGTANQGDILTADGNGGTSFLPASGGTTLNKYTYSGSSVNISKLRNIIENSKGRIVGMIRTRAINTTAGITETLVFLPANCIYNSGTIIRLEHEQVMTLSGTNRQYNVCCNIEITGNNSLNLHVYAYDYANSTMVDCSESAYLNYVSITYWNDTQLH